MIDVSLKNEADPYEFDVVITEANGESRHRVTMSQSTYQKLTGGAATPERSVQAAFEFLLEREPKESNLSSFDVTVISTYFPSFEREFAGYL